MEQTARSKTSVGFYAETFLDAETGKKLRVSPNKQSPNKSPSPITKRKFPQIKNIFGNNSSPSPPPPVPAPLGVVDMLNEEVREELEKRNISPPSNFGRRIVKSPSSKTISPHHGGPNSFNTLNRGPYVYNPKLPQITEKTNVLLMSRRQNPMYRPDDYVNLLRQQQHSQHQQLQQQILQQQPPSNSNGISINNINMNSNLNNLGVSTGINNPLNGMSSKNQGLIMTNNTSIVEGKPALLLEIENFLHRSLQDLAAKMNQRRKENQNDTSANPEKITTPNDVLQRYKIHREALIIFANNHIPHYKPFLLHLVREFDDTVEIFANQLRKYIFSIKHKKNFRESQEENLKLKNGLITKQKKDLLQKSVKIEELLLELKRLSEDNEAASQTTNSLQKKLEAFNATMQHMDFKSREQKKKIEELEQQIKLKDIENRHLKNTNDSFFNRQDMEMGEIYDLLLEEKNSLDKRLTESQDLIQSLKAKNEELQLRLNLGIEAALNNNRSKSNGKNNDQMRVDFANPSPVQFQFDDGYDTQSPDWSNPDSVRSLDGNSKSIDEFGTFVATAGKNEKMEKPKRKEKKMSISDLNNDY